ncbi:MAG: SCO6880 family protein [Cellulomonas sp.]
MSAETAGPVAAINTRFGRLERRGVLLGLSGVQLAFAAVALFIAIIAVYSGGIGGLAVTAVVWGPLFAIATLSVGGRHVVEWIPLGVQWQARRLLGQTTALSSVRHQSPPDQLDLPGIAGRLTVTEGPTSGAALIRDPRAGTISAVLRVSGSGFVLEDATTQDHRVGAWGRVLASLCQQPAIVRVQVLHRSLPGGGGPLREWWRRNALAGAPWAARVLGDLLAQAEASADRRETLIVVALRAARGRAQVLSPGQVATIEQHLAALVDTLSAADLRADGWVIPSELGSVLRASYDPDAAALAGPGSESRLLGPMGVDERWDRLVTDGATHAVFWIVEWPRSEVHPAFLQPLLMTPGMRRTFTLVAEPLPAAKALREIRRAKVEHAADAAQRAKSGQVEDEGLLAERADLLRREQDLIAGHGDLRFTGLITVTTTNAADLAGACAATESAAAQAMCELRRLVGQQGQAHAAAALPLARGLL